MMLIKCFFLAVLLIHSAITLAEISKPITHVVIVWLKEPGNEETKTRYIEESKRLNDLPGIIARHTGVIAPSGRPIADESFDVAVTVTLKDKKALDAYLAHPKHKQILHEKLQPLVKKVVTYDFITP
ncbi:MAG: Dabb family protein [Methylicorpusculum sp.]|uniref:Dabb family protein n=1 Tax=Methylicorpusculum sp. TaxID=2713644 RepID=UPI0027241D87|nr:Dabb family protein [Methylicorpusculum sp.]MDO8940645.1 Dabb family protein [Methylicorpusculum sp.]MDO9238650.1 Dabb family protein [Methylicorpusculum sp.]MDP2202740.1 Dabb family protein [Methylicorpusculum sp.]